ncbi:MULTISPECIES: hypothetical protein [Actinosynnema]|uniref:hypothetical protein n=1 Tax=Actinosynnema TaxID=40566 RepID=UPI0020A4BCAC|nr:hypothetical protein [Actinosynnema pretiosum]MCP2095806.1 hypothetical protein [Actinosynnema pretiosum]
MLTPLEQRLVDHVRSGEVLDLAGDGPVDAAATRSQGPDRTVSARVIRDVVLGRLVERPDPHGLRLRGARIAGRLDLENATGPVAVELLDCLLDGGVNARDADLPALVLRGCRAAHPSEPAIDVEGLRARALGLELLEARADCPRGAVVVDHAGIGLLSLAGASLVNRGGPALSARGLRVERDLFLAHWGDAGFRAVGGGDLVALDLRDARVGGTFWFAPDGLAHASGEPAARLAVAGLTHAGLPGVVAPEEWLRLLREATPAYAAQPYQHLAAAHRAVGHDAQARRVLVAQRRDQLARGALGRGERAWARLTGLLLGHGYQPWRALLGLLAVLVVAVALALALGGDGLARTGTPQGPCPVVERVALGLDVGSPLLTTKPRCEPTGTASGQVLGVAGWLLRLLAWGFATLFVAGFTGAVRKT